MNARGVAPSCPVLLGGAALTRSYVEDDLSDGLRAARSHYARDAFEGLRLMDARDGRASAAARPRSTPPRRPQRAERKARRERRSASRPSARPPRPRRPAPLPGALRRRRRRPDPDAAVLGHPGGQGHRAGRLRGACSTSAPLFLGQWGLRGARGGTGPSYEELVETEGRPRLRYWLDRLATEGVLRGRRRLRVLPGRRRGRRRWWCSTSRPDAPSGTGFTFPRQRRDRRLCLADFFRPRELAVERGEVDVLPLQLVTMGQPIARLRERAVRRRTPTATTWRCTACRAAHRGARRVLAPADPRGAALRRRARPWRPRTRPTSQEFFDLGYRGCRYSFGYGACPDLEDRAKIVDLLRARAHRRGAVRGVPAAPGAVHRRASSSTTRRRSTSTPAERTRRWPDEWPAAVLWDMDGTLVDSEKLWTISLHDTARWLGGELSPRPATPWSAATWPARSPRCFDDLGLPRDPARMADGGAAASTTAPPSCSRAALPWRPGALEALRLVRAAGLARPRW